MTFNLPGLKRLELIRFSPRLRNALAGTGLLVTVTIGSVYFTKAQAQDLQNADYYVEQYISQIGKAREDARLALLGMWGEQVVRELSESIVSDPRFDEPKLRFRTFLMLRNEGAYRYRSAFPAILNGLEHRSSVGLSAQMLQKIDRDVWPDAVRAITRQLGEPHTFGEGRVSTLVQALARFGYTARPAFDAVKSQIGNRQLSPHDRQMAVAALMSIGEASAVLDYYETLAEDLRLGVVTGLTALASSHDSAIQKDTASHVRARTLVLRSLCDPSEDVSRMALNSVRMLYGDELYVRSTNGEYSLNEDVAAAMTRASEVFAGRPWQKVIDDMKARLEEAALVRTEEKR